MHETQVHRWRTLPERYGHLDVVTTTIDAQGRMIALLASPEVGFARPARTAAKVRLPYEAIAVIVEDSGHQEIELKNLDYRWPKIDAFADGLILVNSRCGLPSMPEDVSPWEMVYLDETELLLPLNATIFDADGSPTSAFHVGDAIEVLQTDQRENIWIGYFDESSVWTPAPAHVRHRPQYRGKRTKIRLPGLIRWSVNGMPAWSAGDDPVKLSWMDCYALNVGADRAWACPYTNFPLVTIDDTGVRTINRNSVRGARGLAVTDDEVVFINSYQDTDFDGVTIVRCDRADGVVDMAERRVLTLPDGSQPTRLHRVTGRDHRLWMQLDDDRAWYLTEACEG
ncbi:hypothetical protein ACGFNU_17745 [Spirillospora sp. NPDC048911]|uniref:hypothetical protein n=1 Tax=Spirillospora sp. NPDC048911 TaxID=3364527 RepID=UPI003712EB92